MKKILVLGLVALSTLTANAQRKRTKANTSQGMWAVRLGAGYNSTTTDPSGDAETKATTISVMPSVGYFVADNLELGINFRANSNNTDQTITANPLSTSTSKGTGTGVGIYGQKYWPMNNWFALYGNANIGLDFGSGEVTTLANNVTNKVGTSTNGYGGSVSMGFAFTPVRNMALTADIVGFGVNTSTSDPDGPNNQTVTTNLGANVWRQPFQLSYVWFFGNGGSDY
jgi:hypothetical protein